MLFLYHCLLLLKYHLVEVFLGRDFAQTKDYSEETAALIDEEVKRIVQTAYDEFFSFDFFFFH